jgi:hypothetical protein
MKSIGKHIPLIGILLLTVVIGSAAGLYFDLPARLQRTSKSETAGRQTCSMRPEVVSLSSDNCSKCDSGQVTARDARIGHAGCCAGENATKSATEWKLPPGHPPISGWTVDPTSASEAASTNTPAHSSR